MLLLLARLLHACVDRQRRLASLMHMLMSVVLATRARRAVRARLMRLRTLYMLKTVPWRVQGVHTCNEWWSTCGALEKSAGQCVVEYGVTLSTMRPPWLHTGSISGDLTVKNMFTAPLHVDPCTYS